MNILLTGYLTPEKPNDDPSHGSPIVFDPGRFSHLGRRSLHRAANSTGRLVWIVDGYMTSDAHPYSREIEYWNVGGRKLHSQFGEGDRRCL